MESKSKRLTPLPSLEIHSFFGTPSFEGTPTFHQLEDEIRERAYLLWEKYGWDSHRCWCQAEKTLFLGLEETAFNPPGYRVFVFGEGCGANGCDWKIKIITPKYNSQFVHYGDTEPPRRLCSPVTLCSAYKQRCPDQK